MSVAPLQFTIEHKFTNAGNFQLFSENLGNPQILGKFPNFQNKLEKFGEIGTKRNREIFWCTEMRVTAL
jgi:hypothetical protein